MPLRLLYEPDNKAAEADIIAVHGLNPRSVPEADHAWDTWRKPSGDKGRLWLRDDLPKYAPYARIFLYQYNSKLVYGGDKARFIDKANDLLEALRIERKKDGERPLIFLAHSLGGILVRQALVNAHSNPNYNVIHTSTIGLAFFGTPHEGGDERLVALGTAAARIASALHVQPSNDLVETLKKGSLFSDLLAEQWRHHLESYQLVSFWEGIGDIVPKKSATFGLSGSRENVVRLEATHSDLCRFDEHDYDNSKVVLSNIEDLYEHAISTSHNFDVRQALEWVSRIPYEQHHNTNKSEILQGTGLWLFQEEIFITWNQEYRSTILWLHGIPGCGKTKLVSLVIEEQRAALDLRQGLAFFYCNRNDAEPERANPEDILRSIVRQLSISGPHARFSKVVAEKYTERECDHFVDGPLRLDECVEIIIKLTEEYTGTAIIIDALDECDVSTRHNLLAALSSIMQHGSSTKIFVSSRDDKDITLQLSGLPNLYIKASNNAQDIDQYVHFKVEQAVAERRLLDGNVSAETVQLISNRLTGKAQGMFLWVTLQLQNLCSLRLNVEEDLLEELGRLPQGLANTYAQIFEHVRRLGPQSRVIAESSLKWLLCQARELSEAEFLAAVSMGSERESVNLTKETILFICGNLVMFDHELKVFRFAHLSVREYLETLSNFTLDAGHALGAEISLMVCLHKYTELATKYAYIFRPYALLFWRYHCQGARKSGLSGHLHHLLEDFLNIGSEKHLCYAKWVRSMHRLRQRDAHKGVTWKADSEDEPSDDTDDSSDFGPLKERRPAIGVWNSGNGLLETSHENCIILSSVLSDPDHPYDPTFAACSLDLPEIVEQNLLSMLSSPAKEAGDLALGNIEVFGRRNLRKQTYLHVACLCGSSKLLRLLLRYRFPVGSKDIVGSTALHYAVNSRKLVSLHPARWIKVVPDAHDQAYTAERVAMIGLLLEKGSNIDAVDSSEKTALHRASSANLVTEAQALLEHGASVDQGTYKGQTALHLAAKAGNTVVVQLLLHFNAAIEARDRDGKTPLLLVAELGNTAVVQLLLHFKADIEARDQSGMTPLFLAAKYGHTAVVRLLLQFGADTESRNSDKTPLLLVAELGNTTLVQLLLQCRADIEARDRWDMTPLHRAAESGHTATVQLLLQSKADMEVKDQWRMTPIFKAVAKRQVDTVRLFWQLGADINAKDVLGEALLAQSLRIRDEPMAQMLIEVGASMKECDRYGNTALHYAAESRLGASISRLLEMGAPINETNDYGSTPLHVAIISEVAGAMYRVSHIVHLLLDAGADVEMGDVGGRTPLRLAAQKVDEAGIEILLIRGANIKAEDSKGLLPLDYAAASGSLEVFSFLFKRWVDVMAESSKDAVESWLRLATKTASGVGDDLPRSWRSLSFEDLIDLTSDCEVQGYRGPKSFKSWFEGWPGRRKSQYPTKRRRISGPSTLERISENKSTTTPTSADPHRLPQPFLLPPSVNILHLPSTPSLQAHQTHQEQHLPQNHAHQPLPPLRVAHLRNSLYP